MVCWRLAKPSFAHPSSIIEGAGRMSCRFVEREGLGTSHFFSGHRPLRRREFYATIGAGQNRAGKSFPYYICGSPGENTARNGRLPGERTYTQTGKEGTQQW